MSKRISINWPLLVAAETGVFSLQGVILSLDSVTWHMILPSVAVEESVEVARVHEVTVAESSYAEDEDEEEAESQVGFSSQ